MNSKQIRSMTIKELEPYFQEGEQKKEFIPPFYGDTSLTSIDFYYTPTEENFIAIGYHYNSKIVSVLVNNKTGEVLVATQPADLPQFEYRLFLEYGAELSVENLSRLY